VKLIFGIFLISQIHNEIAFSINIRPNDHRVLIETSHAMLSVACFKTCLFPCQTHDRQTPRASLYFLFSVINWLAASGGVITFSVTFSYNIPFCHFILSLFFSLFNDIRLDVMVGRKYLTAKVGEIRTYFFPPSSYTPRQILLSGTVFAKLFYFLYFFFTLSK